jgi:iron complex outermembrane recepter protein
LTRAGLVCASCALSCLAWTGVLAHDIDDLPPAEYSAEASIPAANDTPASTTVLTPREILAVPRRTAEDALRLVPGLVVVQHASEGKGRQIFLRGFDAAHGSDLEVTVDGVPVNEWSNVHGQGYVDLGFVPPEIIDRVEVTKGPFALDQGAFALAGTARYELALPDEARGLRAAYTVGTTNRHRGLFTYTSREGDGRDFVAVEALHDAGFGQRRRVDRGTAIGKLRLLDSETKGTLTASLALYAAAFELPGTIRNEDVASGDAGFFGAYDDEMQGKSRRALVGLDYARENRRGKVRARAWGGLRSLELLENFTGFLLDPDRGDRRAQEHRALSAGFAVDYELHVGERATFLFGAGSRADFFEQAQVHVDYDTNEELGVQRDLRGAQSITHALVGVRANPLPRLRVTGGARLDLAQIAARDRTAGDATGRGVLAVASPRAVVAAPLSHHVEPTFAYGRGLRPPEARAFTSSMPDRVGIGTDVYDGGEARFTTSDSFEVGARFHVSRFLFGEAAAFATLVARETVYDHVSGTNVELDRTRRLGAELRLASRPVDWLEISADGTAVDGRFVQSGNSVPLAPRFLGQLRAVVAHPKGARGGLRLVGFTPRPLPNGARGESFFTLDATAGYTHKALRIDLELENLTNRRSREGEYHFASHWARGTTPSELPVLQSIAAPPLNARLTLTVVY